ncbi:MFS transporter [Sphaerisporangium sp. TRM90804]|uniref:MFS transporter n=1 Tax=Sphaerisporangium sp. TRM90804 TaxID=3031113 RepID=UPI00244D0486|nr:MFS transporter [Sphaerisporangium sp. TRM90804]MDH2430106.1 MFS transporter [Sphaerisporangium sp. TRM90804]
MVETIPLRRQPDYRLLWSARAVSETGTHVTRLAVPLTAATLLGATPTEMGLLTGAATLPYLLFGLHAGAYVDRLARRRPIMIGCELVAAAAVAAVPLAWFAGLLSTPLLIAVALVTGTCAVVYQTAWFPHIPSVVPEHQRTAAIAGFQAVYSTASVTGPGLAGILVQLLTAPVALVADAASFLVSALCLRSIRSPEPASRSGTAAGSPRRSLLRDIRDGVRAVTGNRVLWTLIGAGVLVNFASAGHMALYVLFAVHTLGLPAWVIGLLTAAYGAGGLVGAAVTPRLARRFSENRVILAGVLFFPLETAALAAAHGSPVVLVPLLVAAYLVSGIAVVAFSVCYGTVQLRESPPEAVGRVNAVMTVSTMGVMTLGGVTGGVLGDLIGLRPALWACAAVLVLAIALVWLSPLRHAPSHAPSAEPAPAPPAKRPAEPGPSRSTGHQAGEPSSTRHR